MSSWEAANTDHHSRFTPARLAAARQALGEADVPVTVCLPARDEQETIGAIIKALLPLRELGVVDQLLVVDDSTDATAEIARSLGAEVHRQSALMPEYGPVLGKGDAMWRALSVTIGEIVCFLDADSEMVGPHFACGLIGPLLEDPGLSFVKGFYRRPFRIGEQVLPDGGGRVTELTARPLLQMFYAELAGIRQPLAGEMAARRGLLERLPFLTGYGVDIALLIDAYAEVGLDGIAQVDLDVRQNAHQTLAELGPMASAVLHAVGSRLRREGRLSGDWAPPLAPLVGAGDGGGPVERPPLGQLRATA